eukprot:8872296-Lingulodinium_polyedra.AAC.1
MVHPALAEEVPGPLVDPARPIARRDEVKALVLYTPELLLGGPALAARCPPVAVQAVLAAMVGLGLEGVVDGVPRLDDGLGLGGVVEGVPRLVDGRGLGVVDGVPRLGGGLGLEGVVHEVPRLEVPGVEGVGFQ